MRPVGGQRSDEIARTGLANALGALWASIWDGERRGDLGADAPGLPVAPGRSPRPVRDVLTPSVVISVRPSTLRCRKHDFRCFPEMEEIEEVLKMTVRSIYNVPLSAKPGVFHDA